MYHQCCACQCHSFSPGFLVKAAGKAAKAPKAKAPAKPTAAAGKSKGKDVVAGVDAAALREEEAGLLAAVQAVQSSASVDAAGAEDRLKVCSAAH